MPQAKIVSKHRSRNYDTYTISEVHTESSTTPVSTESVYVHLQRENSDARRRKLLRLLELIGLADAAERGAARNIVNHVFEYTGTLYEYMRDVNAQHAGDCNA